MFSVLRRLSLIQKILFVVNIFIFVSLLGLGVYLIKHSHDDGLAEIDYDAKNLTDILTYSTSNMIINSDQGSLNDILRALMKQDITEDVQFYSADGTPLIIFERYDHQNTKFKIESEVKSVTGKVVGKLVYTYNKDKVYEETRTNIITISTAIIAALILCSLGILLFVKSIIASFRKIADEIQVSAQKSTESSSHMRGISQQVSTASTEQAAAIQETVATLSEITAMMDKSLQNVNKSTEKANQSYAAAEDGKKAVEETIHAMNEITQANESIMNQVKTSNEEMAEIVKVINEISTKTKVINDIVFQTKLLSFNASVEAARAGEHGKGFAVVAEEVGSLATMSGNAAKEIDSLITQSVQKTQAIVQSNKEQVERAFDIGKQKVENGVNVTQRCGQVLEQLVQNVSEVKEMMTEIETASKEQSIGVQNISVAMNEMDSVTQMNAKNANEADTYSESLTSHSDALMKIVTEMNENLYGTKNPAPQETPKQKDPQKVVAKTPPAQPPKKTTSGGGTNTPPVATKPKPQKQGLLKSFFKKKPKAAAKSEAPTLEKKEAKVIPLEKAKAEPKKTVSAEKPKKVGTKSTSQGEDVVDYNDPRFEEV